MSLDIVRLRPSPIACRPACGRPCVVRVGDQRAAAQSRPRRPQRAARRPRRAPRRRSCLRPSACAARSARRRRCLALATIASASGLARSSIAPLPRRPRALASYSSFSASASSRSDLASSSCLRIWRSGRRVPWRSRPAPASRSSWRRPTIIASATQPPAFKPSAVGSACSAGTSASAWCTAQPWRRLHGFARPRSGRPWRRSALATISRAASAATASISASAACAPRRCASAASALAAISSAAAYPLLGRLARLPPWLACVASTPRRGSRPSAAR